MIGRIATLVGHAKAPTATFMLRHPVKGTRALVAAKGKRGLVTSRAGAALGAMLVVPIGVAALAARSRLR